MISFHLNPLCRNITAKCRFTLFIYLCLKKTLIAHTEEAKIGTDG